MHGEGGLVAGEALAPAAALTTMLATGVLVGLVNGVCVGALRMPAFMVTLTTGMFAGGLAVLLVRLAANTETMFNLPQAFIVAWRCPCRRGGDCLRRRDLGGSGARTRHAMDWMLRAVGYNPLAARVSGVPVARESRPSRTCSAASLRRSPPVLLTGQPRDCVAVARPTAAARRHRRHRHRRHESRPAAAGNVWGTAVGVLFLAVLGNGLTLLNLSDFVITILKGLLDPRCRNRRRGGTRAMSVAAAARRRVRGRARRARGNPQELLPTCRSSGGSTWQSLRARCSGSSARTVRASRR